MPPAGLLLALALLLSGHVCSAKSEGACTSFLVKQGNPNSLLMNFEYLHCIKQEDTCQDLPGMPCSKETCNMETGHDILSLLAGDRADVSYFLKKHACPLTCQLCGPDRRKEEVDAAVEGILSGPCDAGWSYADGACFRYSFRDRSPKSLLTWHEAEAACQADGAHLATVETRAQEHLVLSLVKGRPQRLRAMGLFAWVGLWSERGCTGSTENPRWNWTWVGGTSSAAGLAWQALDWRFNCFSVTMGVPLAMGTMLDGGERLTFRSAQTSQSRRAWLCSKPSRFRTVQGGFCEDVGLSPISDLAACEAATRVLLGADRVAIRRDSATLPFGCHIMKNFLRGPWVSGHPASRNVSAGPHVTLLCQQANATGRAESTPVHHSQRQGGVGKATVPSSLGRTYLISTLVLAALPLLVLLALGRRLLLAQTAQLECLVGKARRALRGWRASKPLQLARGLKSYLLGTPAVDSFAAVVAAGLRQRRRTIASAAAVLLAIFHLFELLRVSFMDESVCTTNGTFAYLRILIVSVHLGVLWAAVAFLVLQRWRAWGHSCPELIFAFVIMALDFAETALLGEQALLVESRLYRQLLWRLLLGACVPPAAALLGNLALMSALFALYRSTIPDGLIFTVGSSRAGLLFQQGCNQLWQPEDAVRLADFWQNVGAGAPGELLAPTEDAVPLLRELLQRRTSCAEFAGLEFVLVAVVVACLVLLHLGMAKDTSKSLRLQSSEDQLEAVSQVLDTQCDATFQLSSDCTILKRAPRLDVLLHLVPTPLELQGTDFRSLIVSPDERASFQAAINQGLVEGVPFGKALYMDLKPAGRNRMRVQLLCARFRDACGKPRLLCGVNELNRGSYTKNPEEGDEEPLGPLGPASPPIPRRSPRERRYEGKKGRGTPRSPGSDGEGDSISGDLSDSASSEASRPSRGRIKRHHGCSAHVVVDTSRIHWVSTRFEDFVGGQINTSRADSTLTMFALEPERLIASLRACVEGLDQDGQAGAVSGELSIKLRRHNYDGATLYTGAYEVHCSVQLLRESERGFDSSTPKVKLKVLSSRRLEDHELPRSGTLVPL